MQVIITKFLPATETKPARIKATSTGGDSITVAYSYDGNDHAIAAKALKDKLGWSAQMVGGHTSDGTVWVFQSDMKID